MGGQLVDHESNRHPVKTQDFGAIRELPKYLKELQAENPENYSVNLFAVYEERRQEFIDANYGPARVVKLLQTEYETRLNDRDIRNLYGWAKEDYNRKRGTKPEIKQRITVADLMSGKIHVYRAVDDSEEAIDA
jgi:hypothetical protein